MAMRGHYAFLLFALFLFLHQTYADKCSAGCTGASQPKDGYQQDQTYSYSVEGNAKIFLSGADEQETYVKLAAQATVVGLGNCANLLKITSLTITGPDGAHYNKPENIEKAVRFTFQDGVIGSDICAEPDDSKTSLNIKRSILSMLQIADKYNTEVDVFGVCPTSFKVHKSGNEVHVTKSRNLNSCAHREHGKHDLLSIINNKALKSSNIIDSSLTVDATLKNGIVEKAEARENYFYVPFSAGSAGAKASVVTKLHLERVNKGSVKAICTEPKSIIFELPHVTSTAHSNVANVQLALQRATQSLGNHVESKSASIFAELIRVLRVSSRDDLNNVYNQIKAGSSVKDNKLARRVFLDALFRTGTGDSTEMSIQLIKNKELNGLEQNIALISLATVLHASSGSVRAAMSLLDVNGLPNEVYLGVGALAGAYCRDHACHGATSRDKTIAELSTKLNTKLGNCKTSDKKSENSVIYTLKAIKNIHHIEDCLIDSLHVCAADKNVKQRVRVAALEAFSADPCISKLKDTAISILKDRQQDSELRIKAYLALLGCPCNKVADELKTLLETETINQVGSFITSSLRNIRASVNPAHETAKQYFGHIKINRKFPLDVRRYSQNYEMSYEHDMIGVGTFADANVIYSQNSFLPRSSNLNLTTELFGRNVNILEVGFRQGNLDRLAEEYFGPHGLFKTHTPQEIYNEVKKRGSSVLDKIKERMEKTRGKRSILQQTNIFGKQLKTDIDGYNGDLDLDVYLRILGSDALFLSLGDDKPVSAESLIDKFFDFVDSGMHDAKDFSHEIRSHLMLLELETGYPTMSGVALKLNVEGTTTSKVQFSCNTDLKQLINDPNNAKIDVQLIPSANIELSGSLLFDVDVFTTGLKVISSLHTSTGMNVVAKTLDNGQSFDVKVGLPVDKQELITANHEIIFITRQKGHQDIEKELKFDSGKRYQVHGCFDQLSSAIGLTLCGNLSVPWALSESDKTPSYELLTKAAGPLSGPGEFSIHLEKEDLKEFHVTGGFRNKNDEKKVELILEAQGLKKNRRVSFLTDVINKENLKSIKISLDAPNKHYSGSLAYVNNNKEKSLSANILENKNDYNAKIGYIVSKSNQKEVYTPILEYKITDDLSGAVQVKGSIIKEHNGKIYKYTTKDLYMIANNEKVHLDGWWKHAEDMKSYEGDLSVKTEAHTAKVNGKYVVTHDGENEHGYDMVVEFHNTINSNIDFFVKSKGKITSNTRDFDLEIVHGPDSKSKMNKLSYNENIKLNDISNFEKLDIYFKNEFKYPLWELEFKTETKIKPKSFDGEFSSKYEASTADFELEYEFGTKHEEDFNGKIKAKVNDKGFEGESKFQVTGDKKGIFSGKLELYPGGKHTVDGTVNYRMNQDDVHVGVNAVYKFPNKNDEYKMDVGFVHTPKNTNVNTKYSVGKTDYVDFFIKVQHVPIVIGNVKIFIKDFINGQGQFKTNPHDNKGNGVLDIEMLKTKRKVRIECGLLIDDPQFNVNVDLYYDFNKDKSKKITFTTNSKTQKNTIDSKNSIAFNDQKMDFSIKGDFSGSFLNGKQNGIITLSHSNGKSVTLNIDREIETIKGESIIGHIDGHLTYTPEKDGKPYKLTVKGKINTQGFEFEDHVTFVKPTGEEFDIKVLAKKYTKNNRHNMEGKLGVSGALSPNTINLDFSCDYNKDVSGDKGDLKYKLKGSYGPKSTMDVSGTLLVETQNDQDTKLKNDMNILMTLPMEKAHNIKITTNNYLFIPKDEKYVETKSTMAVQLNAETYKYDMDFWISNESGKAKLYVLVPKQEKFLAEINYKTANDDKQRKCQSKLTVEYGVNQKLVVTLDGNKTPDDEGEFKAEISLPSDFKKAKQINSVLKLNKHTADSLSFDVVVDVDNEKYTFDLNSDFTNAKIPIIEIKGSCPTKKPYRFYLKGDMMDIRAIKIDTKMENFGDFNFDMNVDAQVDSVDEFNVKIYIDSEQLKLNKVHFNVINEAKSKGAKKIQFSATEADKNILSGSTTYHSRQDGNKYTIEGSGALKLRDQQKSTSFKYIEDKLIGENEKGKEIFLNAVFGEKSVAIEYKKTNIVYKLTNTYCEEKKQCAHVNIYSMQNNPGFNHFISEAEVSIDLRRLGFIPEFGLQTKTVLEPLRLPTHTFDIHMNLEKSKYHSEVFSKSADGKYSTGLTLTMPQRIVSLESLMTYSDKNSEPVFPFIHELTFYSNKNLGEKTKTMLKTTFNAHKHEEDDLKTELKILFKTPGLDKDLEVSGNTKHSLKTYAATGHLSLDLFKKKQHKIDINAEFKPDITNNVMNVKSHFIVDGKNLGFLIHLNEEVKLTSEEFVVQTKAKLEIEGKAKEATVFMNVNPKNQKLIIKSPSTELINFENSVTTKQGESGEFDGSLSIFKEKLLFNGKMHSKPTYGFKFTTEHEKSNKLVVSGKMDKTKMAEVDVTFVENGAAKPLVKLGMKMDGKKLKPDNNINNENIKHFVKAFSDNLNKFVKHCETQNKLLRDQTVKDYQKIASLVEVSSPDFKGVYNHISDDLSHIKEELNNDKSLQKFLKSFTEFTANAINTVTNILKEAFEVIEKTWNLIVDTTNKFRQIVDEKVIPEISEIYSSISSTILSLVDSTVSVITHCTAAVFDFLEKNAAEFQPLTDTLNSIMSDINEMLSARLEEMLPILEEMCETLKNGFENSAIYAMLKERWESSEVKETLISFMETCKENISNFLPTEESRKLLDRIVAYLKKKINNEKCNDLEELKSIYNDYNDTVYSLIKEQKLYDDSSIFEFFFLTRLNFNLYDPTSPSWSVYNYITKEDSPSIEDIIRSYRLRSFDPRDLVPPYKLKGIIAGGQHVFTFDGRHMTFPGDCKYVVSQDAVDGNFSMIITLAKGNPKSVTLVDKSGSEVEYNTNGHLTLNGSPHGFPLIKADTIAWKAPETFTIMTHYGASVKCSFNLDLCYFEVSGFYTAKLRGLLGDGNNEQYDDFRLPNGKITLSESDFGNSYALTNGCPKVKTVDHSGHSHHGASNICDQIFAENTDQSICSLAVDTKNYKQACQHATQGTHGEKTKREACLIARAYNLACHSSAFPVDLPDICSTCYVDGASYELNQEFIVKTPQKKADIILAVETTKDNEKTYKDMILPLMSQVIDELKTKQINDVKVHLIGVSPKLIYPIYYDIHNNKLQDTKIEFRDEQRSKKWESLITTEDKNVDNFLNKLAESLQEMQIELGLNNIHWTYAKIGKIQLRPKAVKTIIMVHSEPCAEANFPLIQWIGSAISELFLTEQGIVAHLIVPIFDLQADNVKQSNNIVGFNANHVFLLGDKKRGLSNPNLRSSLTYNDDICISHAEESYGNIYSSKNYFSVTGGQRKAYLNMISHTIVDSLVGVVTESGCKCENDLFNPYPKVSCIVQTRKDNKKTGLRKK